MSAPIVVHEDERLQIATWSRVFINRWKTAATVEHLDVLFEHERALIDSVGDGRIVVLTTLQDRTGMMPDGRARKRAERIALATRSAQILQAQVVEGDGFVSATARALLTGVTLASRVPYPIKVFRSESAALPWIGEGLARAGYGRDAAGLAAALGQRGG